MESLNLGVPTLNHGATLAFDVSVASLDAATHTAFLTALDAGTATMATKADTAGSSYQAFPLCTRGGVPTAGGCVLVQKLDASGQPTTAPVVVRFSNVVGHFSRWAVAIVTERSQTGRMRGDGFIDQAGKRHDFEFFVRQKRNGEEGGRIVYRVTVHRPGDHCGHDGDRGADSFRSTAVTAVTVSHDPSIQTSPRHDRRPTTVVFSGVGLQHGPGVRPRLPLAGGRAPAASGFPQRG